MGCSGLEEAPGFLPGSLAYLLSENRPLPFLGMLNQEMVHVAYAGPSSPSRKPLRIAVHRLRRTVWLFIYRKAWLDSAAGLFVLLRSCLVRSFTFGQSPSARVGLRMALFGAKNTDALAFRCPRLPARFFGPYFQYEPQNRCSLISKRAHARLRTDLPNSF